MGITQCPIPDGQSITYEPLNSNLSPAERKSQWGTFWTHGHYSGQYVDGLRTPSIIHNAAGEVHQYDEDYTIILADWYHREHQDLLVNDFLNTKNPSGAEPVPDSAQLYIAHTPANGTATYLEGFNENSTLPFQTGKSYRLRLINMSALSMFHFWIEGHDMQIIEADGVDMEAFPIDYVTLSVAQRYSVLVQARNDTSQNWLMHANMDPEMFDQVPDALQLNITSTISYGADKANVGSDRPTLDAYDMFDDTQLVPSAVEPMVPADVSHDLNVFFTTYSDGKNYASFNNITYVQPLVPSILSAKTTTDVSLRANPATYGLESNAYVVNHLNMVELTIYNWDAGFHPFHLHGTQFQVVHKSMDVTSDDPTVNPPFVEGKANPMRRDTVTVPSGGSATLRFRADNPGAWFLHCHIDWHLSSGLAAIILQAPEIVAQNQTLPSEIASQCAALGMPTSGNAGGVMNSVTNFGTLRKAPALLTTGWTATAVGTFTACLITALLGIATICWYGFSSGLQEDEDEAKGEGETQTQTQTQAQT